MSAEFTKIVHSTVLESAIPAKVLAKKIGKPYSTLLREINPYDQGAKLGVETFMDILKITGDVTAVEYIANELGFDLVPKQMRKTG